MFVTSSVQQRAGSPIFSAAAGRHAHFPLWSPLGRFIYFVQGSLLDVLDVWRVDPAGGEAERITTHNARVSHPVLLNDRTLLYLATDGDGAGPWLYSLDVEERRPRRVGSGVDRYTSLAATADGRRLVATLSNPKGTFWRLRVGDTADAPSATPISLTTGRGSSPRLGPGYLLYVASAGAGEGVWKLVDGAATPLWSAPGARIVGGPEIASDGRRVAFSVELGGQRHLYTMNADGTNQRLLADTLDLRGAPSWTPDGQSITSAVSVEGTPQLFSISLDGASQPLVREYSVDPAWSPTGDFVVYSGADVGIVFSVKAVTASAEPYNIPALNLTRGVRRLRVLRDGRTLVAMLGGIQQKDVWLIDLKSGARRQITTLPDDFGVADFDVSPDGRDVVLERVQEHADIVMIDLAP
jgi:Tol biopolymer transport system component